MVAHLKGHSGLYRHDTSNIINFTNLTIFLPFKCWNSLSSFFRNSTCSMSCFCNSSASSPPQRRKIIVVCRLIIHRATVTRTCSTPLNNNQRVARLQRKGKTKDAQKSTPLTAARFTLKVRSSSPNLRCVHGPR